MMAADCLVTSRDYQTVYSSNILDRDTNAAMTCLPETATLSVSAALPRATSFFVVLGMVDPSSALATRSAHPRRVDGAEDNPRLTRQSSTEND